MKDSVFTHHFFYKVVNHFHSTYSAVYSAILFHFFQSLYKLFDCFGFDFFSLDFDTVR